MKVTEFSTGASRFDRLETMAYVIATALKMDEYREKKYTVHITEWRRTTVSVILEERARFLWIIPTTNQKTVMTIESSDGGKGIFCTVYAEKHFDLIKKELEKFCEEEKKISSDAIEEITINKEFEKKSIRAKLKEVNMAPTQKDGALSLPETTVGALSTPAKTKGAVTLVKSG